MDHNEDLHMSCISPVIQLILHYFKHVFNPLVAVKHKQSVKNTAR